MTQQIEYTAEDTEQIRALIEGKWPNSQQVDHYTREATSTGIRLQVPVEEVLQAIEEHQLNGRETDSGDTIGTWPPQPADLKRELMLASERYRREQKAVDVQMQMEIQRDAAQTPFGIPNMPKGVREWMGLVRREAAYIKTGRRPLTETEQVRYNELAAYFKPEPVAPKVKAYWAAEADRRQPTLTKPMPPMAGQES